MKKVMLSLMASGICIISLQAMSTQDWIYFKGNEGSQSCTVPFDAPKGKKAIACCENFWEIKELDNKAYGYKEEFMKVCVPKAAHRLGL